MALELEFLIVGISIVVIARSAGWLVESAARIASRFGVSELLIGLTIVAFGTSAPEFAVSLNAALRGMGNIAIGNVVGSNIFNLCIILGLSSIVRPIKVNEKLVKRDCVFLLLGTVILSSFIFNLSIGRIEGAILFVLLIFYVGYLIRKKESHEDVEIPTDKAKWSDVILLVGGLAGTIGGAHFLVSSSVNIARAAGISEWVIGVTLVAFGTSVPELAVSITAVIKKRYAISAGNLIGSDIFNMFGVVGVAGILAPMSFDIGARVDVFILIGIVGLVMIFMRTGWILSRKEGMLLVLVGVVRWYQLLM
ncbi:calcium/sodium antiporter [archaeon]|nr:calcium/sodium antiporter [archaeon]